MLGRESIAHDRPRLARASGVDVTASARGLGRSRCDPRMHCALRRIGVVDRAALVAQRSGCRRCDARSFRRSVEERSAFRFERRIGRDLHRDDRATAPRRSPSSSMEKLEPMPARLASRLEPEKNYEPLSQRRIARDLLGGSLRPLPSRSPSIRGSLARPKFVSSKRCRAHRRSRRRPSHRNRLSPIFV